MSLEALKIKLIERLLKVKEGNILEKIQDVLDAETNPIVGYSIDGKPLDKQAYNAMLAEGEQEIKAGKTITTDQLRKELSSWKTK